MARYYNVSFQSYFVATKVPLSLRLNGYTVQNKGTTNVIINGQLTLGPDESVSVGGNEGEEYVGRLDVKFEVPNPAPLTITNNATVMQKFYTEGRGYDPVKEL